MEIKVFLILYIKFAIVNQSCTNPLWAACIILNCDTEPQLLPSLEMYLRRLSTVVGFGRRDTPVNLDEE